MALQLEGRLRETLERLKLGDLSSATGNSVGNSNHLEALLQHLLSAARTQASRLAKLETSCLSSPGAGMATNSKTGFQLPGGVGAEPRAQEVTSREEAVDAVHETRMKLEEVQRYSRQRYLPAGKSLILASAICLYLFSCLSICIHRSQLRLLSDFPLSVFFPVLDTFRSGFK